MSGSALSVPQLDPAPIVEIFRGSYGTELLTAAVTEFGVFARLSEHSRTFEELREQVGLERRPAQVLFTALRAMKLLTVDASGRLTLTDLAREHLVPGGAFDMSNYIGLAAASPGVREMIERLRSNRPAGHDDGGAAFI